MWGNIFFYALPSKIHKKGENYIHSTTFKSYIL